MRKFFAILILCFFVMPQLAGAEQYDPETLKASVASVMRSERAYIHYKYTEDYDNYAKMSAKAKHKSYKKMYLDMAGTVHECISAKGNGMSLAISGSENGIMNKEYQRKGYFFPKSLDAVLIRPDGVFTYMIESDGKPQNIKRCSGREADMYNHRQQVPFLIGDAESELHCVIDKAEREAAYKSVAANNNTASKDANGVYITSGEDIFDHSGSVDKSPNEYAGSGIENYNGKAYQYLEYRTPPDVSIAWTKRLYFDDGKLVRLVIRRDNATTTIADTLRPFSENTICLSGAIIYEIYKFTAEVDDYEINPLGNKQI